LTRFSKITAVFILKKILNIWIVELPYIGIFTRSLILVTLKD